MDNFIYPPFELNQTVEKIERIRVVAIVDVEKAYDGVNMEKYVGRV